MPVYEILAIIKACREYGVAILKFGDLHLELASSAPLGSPEVESSDMAPAKVTEVPQSSVDEITVLQNEAAKKDLLESEQAFKRDQLDQMFIEDPSQAEELLTQGDLEDDGSEREEDA